VNLVSSGHNDLSGVRVLLVDDERDGREFTRLLLEDHHATVVACESGARALEAFDACPPTVVVSDLLMPDMDGFDLIEAVRAYEERRGLRPAPALALTAVRDDSAVTRAGRKGFQSYMEKPFSPESFLDAVAALARSL